MDKLAPEDFPRIKKFLDLADERLERVGGWKGINPLAGILTIAVGFCRRLIAYHETDPTQHKKSCPVRQGEKECTC